MNKPYNFKDLWLYWQWRRSATPQIMQDQYREEFYLTYGVLLDDPSYPVWDSSEKTIVVDLTTVPTNILDNIHAATDLVQENLPGGRPVKLPGGAVAPPPLVVLELLYTIRATQDLETGSWRGYRGEIRNGQVIGTQGFRSNSSPQVDTAVRDLCSSGDNFFRELALQKLMEQYASPGTTLDKMESRIPWVFISYRSIPEDEAFARKLASAIDETMTRKAWFFPWEAKLSDPVPGTIDQGMKRCSAGVIVYSPEFFNGAWADYEYQRLITDKVKGRKIVIGALLRGEPGTLPKPIDVNLYADFKPPNEFDQAFQKLYRGLLGKPLEDKPK